jgi:hypothetical protein
LGLSPRIKGESLAEIWLNFKSEGNRDPDRDFLLIVTKVFKINEIF